MGLLDCSNTYGSRIWRSLEVLARLSLWSVSCYGPRMGVNAARDNHRLFGSIHVYSVRNGFVRSSSLSTVWFLLRVATALEIAHYVMYIWYAQRFRSWLYFCLEWSIVIILTDFFCRIWGYRSGGHEEFYLLGYNTEYPAYYLLHAGFLLGLLFDPEDRGTCSSVTSVDLRWTTRRYVPEDRTLRQTFCFWRQWWHWRQLK
jgi:hypothetical protein